MTKVWKEQGQSLGVPCDLKMASSLPRQCQLPDPMFTSWYKRAWDLSRHEQLQEAERMMGQGKKRSRRLKLSMAIVTKGFVVFYFRMNNIWG